MHQWRFLLPCNSVPMEVDDSDCDLVRLLYAVGTCHHDSCCHAGMQTELRCVTRHLVECCTSCQLDWQPFLVQLLQCHSQQAAAVYRMSGVHALKKTRAGTRGKLLTGCCSRCGVSCHSWGSFSAESTGFAPLSRIHFCTGAPAAAAPFFGVPFVPGSVPFVPGSVPFVPGSVPFMPRRPVPQRWPTSVRPVTSGMPILLALPFIAGGPAFSDRLTVLTGPFPCRRPFIPWELSHRVS